MNMDKRWQNASAIALTLAAVGVAYRIVWSTTRPVEDLRPTPIPASALPTPDPEETRREAQRAALAKSIATAFSSAPHVHLTITNADFPGKKRTVWKEGNQLRDETEDRIYVFDGKKRWLWLKKENLVRAWQDFPENKVKPPHESRRFAGGFYSSLAEQLTSAKTSDRIDFSSLQQNGKTISTQGRPGTTIALAPSGYLPISEKQEFEAAPTQPRGKPAGGGALSLGRGASGGAAGGGRRTIIEAAIRYDDKPPAGTFQLLPAQAAKAIDLDERQNYWHALVRKTTLATVRQGTSACTIRHLSVGSGGEIFALYTGNWPDGHAVLDLAGKTVRPGSTNLLDDQKRRYRRLMAVYGIDSTLFYDNWLPGAVKMRSAPEPGSPPIQLAVLSSLRAPGGTAAKELVFAESGATTRIPLPPPLAVELPEYLTVLDPYAALGKARDAAIVQRILSAPREIKEGRPAAEVADECEALAQGRTLSWEALLKLGQADEAAGRRDLALSRFEQARKDYLAQPGAGPSLPPELKGAMDRLAP